MTEHTKTIKHYTCNICEKECNPVTEISKHIVYLRSTTTIEMPINLRNSSPYGGMHICKECLIKEVLNIENIKFHYITGEVNETD